MKTCYPLSKQYLYQDYICSLLCNPLTAAKAAREALLCTHTDIDFSLPPVQNPYQLSFKSSLEVVIAEGK